MSNSETSFIYSAKTHFSEKAVTKRERDEKKSPEMERYTIFHALFEAMKEKDKKHKRR